MRTYVGRQQIYFALQCRSYLTMINPDASFHSGKGVTAKDVKATLNHHLGEEPISAAKRF